MVKGTVLKFVTKLGIFQLYNHDDNYF